MVLGPQQKGSRVVVEIASAVESSLLRLIYREDLAGNFRPLRGGLKCFDNRCKRWPFSP